MIATVYPGTVSVITMIDDSDAYVKIEWQCVIEYILRNNHKFSFAYSPPAYFLTNEIVIPTIEPSVRPATKKRVSSVPATSR